MSEVHEEFRNLKNEMSKINTQRGGSSSGLKGFYAEDVNVAYDNLRRIDDGIIARQIVIDNNGDADAIIRYSNGQFGREIQYKNGYDFSKHKEFLSSGKYDNMIYAINNDNPIFSNTRQLEMLNAMAKEHNIKIVRASVSDREMKILANAATFEGNVRSTLGVNSSPKITLELYVDEKEVKYHFEKVIEKQSEINSYIANQTSSFLANDLARINTSGVNQALNAAQFATALSVTQNAISLIKGEEDIDDATIEVIKDTSKAAVMAYATSVATEVMSFAEIDDATLLINGTIKISKQILLYANGEIDETQFIQSVAEASAYLTAAYIGKTIGGTVGTVGGPVGIFVGQFIGEMITTAICSTIIDTIHREQDANKYHKKMLALAHRAEHEIRESQDRLIILVNEGNSQFIDAINDGYDSFISGLLNNDYEEASSGLVAIGKEFGIDAKKLTQGHVVQGSIFGEKNRVIKLG